MVAGLGSTHIDLKKLFVHTSIKAEFHVISSAQKCHNDNWRVKTTESTGDRFKSQDSGRRPTATSFAGWMESH